ncbi:MAG TPA: DegT/DnrJ/EryC1/StrS family aminotransferase [Solirubrobacterales bacterium]|nr:DegT/DnrJ/EryC1/StrS family aminotransferase [Solirubrobacterales bacterium]
MSTRVDPEALPSPAGIAELTSSLRRDLAAAATRVIDSGWLVLGPEVEAFEEEFSDWAGATACVGVASGTDALTLILMAAGIGPGDEVIVPSNALPTAFGVAASGATLRFADVGSTDYNLDPDEVERLTGPRTRAVVAVHLYGHPARTDEIARRIDRSRIALIEDCAQAHGAQFEGSPVGLVGDAAAWSFYPTKNLGALGDGGAVTTSDTELAERVRSLRVYGEEERYRSPRVGTNSRLDELQAAMLRVKLAHLEEWQRRRREVAATYDELLAGSAASRPPHADDITHARHLYPARVPDRDALRAGLSERGLNLGIHYPLGAHQQPCFSELADRALPVTEDLAGSLLSLPMHPFVSEPQAQTVAEMLLAGLAD